MIGKQNKRERKFIKFGLNDLKLIEITRDTNIPFKLSKRTNNSNLFIFSLFWVFFLKTKEEKEEKIEENDKQTVFIFHINGVLKWKRDENDECNGNERKEKDKAKRNNRGEN